jgi:hypothetical protein
MTAGRVAVSSRRPVRQMYVPVTLELDNGQVARTRVKVRSATSEIELALMPSKPKGLKFNDLDGVLAEVKMVGW